MTDSPGGTPVVRQHHEQMLKLVAKGFYRELINYGVNESEIITVAGHLLDNLLRKDSSAQADDSYYNRLFRMPDIRDEWTAAERLHVHEVSLRPVDAALAPRVIGWLADPAVRESFVSPFPESATDLAAYLQDPERQYFAIEYRGEPAGIIGAENLDPATAKLEMRKLVDKSHRGKGVGKRATFLFLYHAFEIRRFNKVYLHSTDINIRNLNLNSKFGFELEGVFFEEALAGGQLRDVVRMGLRAQRWRRLFRVAEAAATDEDG